MPAKTNVIDRMEKLAKEFRRLEVEFNEIHEGPAPRHETETEQEAQRWAGNYAYSLGDYAKRMEWRVADLRKRVGKDKSKVASGRALRYWETEIALGRCIAAKAGLMYAGEGLRACGKTTLARLLEERTLEIWQPTVDTLKQNLGIRDD